MAGSIDAADTLLAIINDILDFSKVEAGAMEIEQSPFDMHATVENALELVAAKAAEKGLELVCQIEPEVPAWVIGDSVRVKQVLLRSTQRCQGRRVGSDATRDWSCQPRLGSLLPSAPHVSRTKARSRGARSIVLQ